MKCKVCGRESGKYPLCKVCNLKKEQEGIVKCDTCGQWHDKDGSCPEHSEVSGDRFLYESKQTLITKSEQSYFEAIKISLPEGYFIFPQINLAAFIRKTDHSKYQNELFRNVDFLITDHQFTPKIVVEINDRSHLSEDRRERDEKVKNILEEAGVPFMALWTSYGVNVEYIKGKITEILQNPTVRKHHFELKSAQKNASAIPDTPKKEAGSKKKQGCYIATCIYGSYDCPQVWTLRRFRDNRLSACRFGRLFIKIYYAVSPIMVKWFGNSSVFRYFWKKVLDRLVHRLNSDGYEDVPYQDPRY